MVGYKGETPAASQLKQEETRGVLHPLTVHTNCVRHTWHCSKETTAAAMLSAASSWPLLHALGLQLVAHRSPATGTTEHCNAIALLQNVLWHPRLAKPKPLWSYQQRTVWAVLQDAAHQQACQWLQVPFSSTAVLQLTLRVIAAWLDFSWLPATIRQQNSKTASSVNLSC
jgi:hypothetical protein